MKLRVFLSTDDSEQVFLLKQSRCESETADFRDWKRPKVKIVSQYYCPVLKQTRNNRSVRTQTGRRIGTSRHRRFECFAIK